MNNHQLNAYSSPDGTLYVESGLAELTAQNAGLWAAVLAHEMAHVIHRDWARRYLYEKSLEQNGSASIVLGDFGMPSTSWTDGQKASADFGRFCRQLEIDADREALALMARAGYHPDFLPALLHLLHAQAPEATDGSTYAMHPDWEERDRELNRAYIVADVEFEHLWPEWYSSPGGNPPVVVFTEKPVLRKFSAQEWELKVPIRCDNLAGAVEVIVHFGPALDTRASGSTPAKDPSRSQISQLTGCTSPLTTLTFMLPNAVDVQKRSRDLTVFVLDSWGGLLARADVGRR